MRLDIKTATQLEISRERAKKLIENGSISVNTAVQIYPSFIIKETDIIALIGEMPLPVNTSVVPNFDIPLDIIFEDDGILVINKQKGLIVHEGNSESFNTVSNILIARYGSAFAQVGSAFRPGIVHRLDKDTTGLMVIAKTQKTFDMLTKMIQNREITRKYLAVCSGVPIRKAGTINVNIGTDPQNKTRKKAMQIGGREAVTHYKVISFNNDISLMECTLETGRTHQIRVHLSHIGHPIIGDRIYNKYSHIGVNKQFSGQVLHAYKLELKNPTTNEVLQLTCYGDMKETFKLLNLQI